MYYIELTQNGDKIMVNMDNVLSIEPSAIGTSVYMEKRILCVDESYEEIRNILFKHQGGIISPVRLTK